MTGEEKMAVGELDRSLGALIRQKRNSMKITQEKMAELIGKSIVQYRNIERGKTRSNWVTIAKICLVLELDVSLVIDTYIRPEINGAGEFLGVTV